MKRFLPLLFLLPLLAGCGQEEADPNAVAGQAARTYYEYLVKGNCEAWVDGFYQPDSLPGSYRSQLVDAAKMLVAQQKEERGGMKSVDLVSAKADTAARSAQAILLMHYGNGSKEQVVVPLVMRKGLWYLR